MRVKKTLLNAITNSAITIIRSFLLFAVRMIFVRTLGKLYLGVDSLFTNLLSVLTIAELGISTAINFSLYKPLADKDYNKVSALMTFYKKVYNILGIIVLIIGLILIPFLNIIVNENIQYLYLIYFLYLIPTVLSYFISYKDALLNADQNTYQSSLIVGGTYILMYVFRIIFLLTIPNFIIYVLIQLIMIILQRVLVNCYITKHYSYINFKSKQKIEKKEQKNIFKNIKSMFMHKIGNYLVTGTDSIIISATPKLGVSLVGVFTNYTSFTNVIDTIISRGLAGITASFGDLAVNESEAVQEEVFNIIAFISSMIFGLFCLGFIFLLTPFIKICFGNSYELSASIVLIISINFYLIGILKALDIIKEATGNYNADRYAPLIQAIINLIVSIILCKYIGLIGVVLGTLISTIVVPLWNKPYIVYKHVFQSNVFRYFIMQFKYLFSLILIYFICGTLFKYLVFNNLILAFIIKGVLLIIVFVLIQSILFRKTKEYQYIINLIKKH